MTIPWCLDYHPSITEDVWNRVIEALDNSRMVGTEWVAMSPTYNSFKNNGYLRSYVTGKTETYQKKWRNVYCVDNNPQGIRNKITIEDLLAEYSPIEIY